MNFIKSVLFLNIITSVLIYYKYLENNFIYLNYNYFNIQKGLNITFQNKIKKKIKIGTFTIGLKNGGRARITSLLLNYLNKINIFDIYLLTLKVKEIDEYIINQKNIKRILIKIYNIENLIKEIKKKKINILIYQLSNRKEISFLNKIKNIKIIFYLHQSLFYWIYSNYLEFKYLYKEYQNSKYIVSLVPFENNYLFKKWGINSILMNNFVTFEYNYIIPSNLLSKEILMVGRGADKYKRFNLGIQSMEYIIEEIFECNMKIISEIEYIFSLINLVNNLNLENRIKFIGFTVTPEIYFKNASIHFFPTLSESFGLVLSETKIYGIPNILVGLDYVSIAKGGTFIIYDDSPESIAREAIKILKNDKYKKELGREARLSMEKFQNKILAKRWINLILSIYNNDTYYELLRKKDEIGYNNIIIDTLKRQIQILINRNNYFENVTINNIGNFSYLEQINDNII